MTGAEHRPTRRLDAAVTAGVHLKQLMDPAWDVTAPNRIRLSLLRRSSVEESACQKTTLSQAGLDVRIGHRLFALKMHSAPFEAHGIVELVWPPPSPS